MKVVITGGHHNSALVIAKLLINKKHQVFWIGHRYTMVGDKNDSAEYLEVTKEHIKFFSITAGKWQKRSQLLLHILRIPVGFVQSALLLLKIKPDIIMSFGGYLALPVAWCGWLLGIPVYTHEQTAVSGLANRLISPVAKIIFTSFPPRFYHYPPNKMIYTGLPLRKSIFLASTKLFNNNKQTIYITGGKQGAHAINEVIFKSLPNLAKHYNIIHQCGANSIYNDLAKGLSFKKAITAMGGKYLVKDYFFENEIGQIFLTADIVISRAGAHTIYELLALDKPAIIIPLPDSNMGESKHNAVYFYKAGLGIVLKQENLTPESLIEAISAMLKNITKYKIKNDYRVPLDAENVIIDYISEVK